MNINDYLEENPAPAPASDNSDQDVIKISIPTVLIMAICAGISLLIAIFVHTVKIIL